MGSSTAKLLPECIFLFLQSTLSILVQLTDESEVMENGLVSQHAYTVTGAEQVRLNYQPGVCPLGSSKQESGSDDLSKPKS